MREAQWPLRSLFWEATLRCNAFCAFCGSRCGEIVTEDLPAELVKKALRETAEAFDARRIMLNVTGGEPLLRQDLFEVLAYARDLGYPWGMVTNGTLITSEVVAKMRETGMRTISISLDGLEAYHERVRRLPGGFQKIRRAVELLRRANFLQELQITTVVNRQNLDQLEALYALLLDWGVDSWRVATVDPIGRAKEQEALLLTPADRQRVLDFLDRHAFDPHLRVHTSCSHFLGEADALYRGGAFTCATGREVASILANGDLFVCPNVERRPEWIQGNLRTHSLPQVWREGYAVFRDDAYRRVGACAECPQWERCRGDSFHTWDGETRSPRICWQRQEGTPAEPGSADLPPEVWERLRRHTPKLRGVRFSYGSSAANCAYFSPDASEELWAFLAWGRDHPRNRCELMCALYGWRWGDRCLVAFTAPIPLESRSETQAAFSQRSYQAALEELEILRRGFPEAEARYRLADEPPELLGFLHTHPGKLKPILSVPDLTLFDRLRREENLPLFALAHPQSRDLCVYWNSAYVPADAEVLLPADRAELFAGLQIGK